MVGFQVGIIFPIILFSYFSSIFHMLKSYITDNEVAELHGGYIAPSVFDFEFQIQI